MSARNPRPLTAARRGAAFLDRKLGRGWRRKIKRRELDMAAGSYIEGECGCILAQLYGGFVYGANELDLPYKRCIWLGFDGYDYDGLTEAWLTVLREKP